MLILMMQKLEIAFQPNQHKNMGIRLLTNIRHNERRTMEKMRPIESHHICMF